MNRIRNLELLFNLEKKNLKSKEDCVVAALHCLLINENNLCVGTGDEWVESVSTELLPEDWNSNQDVYSLRYTNRDKTSRILLKATKEDKMNILQVDAVMNEEVVASLAIPVNNYISDDYSEYSSAFKDLESLGESFRKNILENLKPKEKEPSSKKSYPADRSKSVPSPPPSGRSPLIDPYPRDPFQPDPRDPLRADFRDPLRHPRLPRVGGSDLDPFGGPGGGGMFMDPSSFGIPSRPTLPDFGIGGPGGLPRGSVPPGARFYPFMPPIHRPDRGRDPNGPPGFEDDYFM